MVERIVTAYHSPRKPVPMNWGTNGTVFQKGGGTNPFSVITQDPNSNSFPIWYGIGRSGIDGNFTLALTTGFTPPLTIVVWEWNPVITAWVRLGSNASEYQTIFDATYTQAVFDVSEKAYILVQTSAAVTGAAYMDGTAEYNQVGAPQEG